MHATLMVLHILGAATWFGANVTQFIATPHFVKAGGETTAHWWRLTLVLGRALYPAAGTVLGVTGVLLVVTSNGGYSFADPFVGAGIATIVIGVVIGVTVFGPQGGAAAELRSAGENQAALAPEARVRLFGSVDTVLLVLTIVAMVTRWGV